MTSPRPRSSIGSSGRRVLLRSFFSPTLVDRVQPVPPTAETGLAQLVADKRALAKGGEHGTVSPLRRVTSKYGLSPHALGVPHERLLVRRHSGSSESVSRSHHGNVMLAPLYFQVEPHVASSLKFPRMNTLNVYVFPGCQSNV